MKRFFILIWMTALCFLLLGNVHAWDVPNYLRISSGARMWFTNINGDLIQRNKIKLDLIDNVGLTKDKLAWEFWSNFRFSNIHVLRLQFYPAVTYESANDSYLTLRTFRAGYDLDFYMTPQLLFGANIDLNVSNYESRVREVVVGNNLYDYYDSQTKTIPMLGLHGTFYPILENIALRPNISSRVSWWNYESLETWDWEVAAAVDVPINQLWTWTVNGGYRFWHTKVKRDQDTPDINRQGFFIESSLLF